MNIGVFFGGKNTEHDVSIITGQLIIQGLKELGHTPVPVYISKEGKWYADMKMDSVDFFKNIKSDKDLNGLNEFTLKVSDVAGKKLKLEKTSFFGKEIEIELAIPALHGLNGEDGTIQGFFELLNIPYVGCNVVASAITIDKVLTKLFYQRFKIPTTKFVYFDTDDWLKRKNEIIQEITTNLPWPVIIKPARLGSSIGISKAKSNKELEFAIEVALHYDSKVIVEECVEDLMDATVCIIGNKHPKASLIQESIFSQDLFSYEDKYLNEGGAQLGNADNKIIIPARLEENIAKEIKEQAIEIYKLLGCSGIARVDFLYNKTFKKYYVNEINPLPGTIYHHLWKKSGFDLKDLLSQLIDFAKEKHNEKNRLSYTFDSAILQKANSKSMKLKGI